nr:PREDICTED: uncharacterized protein LOC107398748 [Tribolium castaneum]|eukprot:XP_015839417.1 PREDICTED: uncharacterized protein LOC107398748 [Tribolium castaneum]
MFSWRKLSLALFFILIMQQVSNKKLSNYRAKLDLPATPKSSYPEKIVWNQNNDEKILKNNLEKKESFANKFPEYFIPDAAVLLLMLTTLNYPSMCLQCGSPLYVPKNKIQKNKILT